MYLPVLQDSRLYEFLFDVDQDLASEARRAKCRFCGAVLHSACYPRKPRGLPAGIDPGPAHRIRFLGPKVYLGVMVVLLTAMRQGPTPQSARSLHDIFGVDRRTLARWRVWWQTLFPKTGFWRQMKARFMPPVDQDGLPEALVGRFRGDNLFNRVVRVLKFLSRLTTAF